MKRIPLRNDTDIKSREILEAVISRAAQGQGINADEMRRRCRLLDALEKAQDSELLLEDADHGLLVRLINGYQFALAHPQLLTIIDDVVDAKEPAPVAAG